MARHDFNHIPGTTDKVFVYHSTLWFTEYRQFEFKSCSSLVFVLNLFGIPLRIPIESLSTSKDSGTDLLALGLALLGGGELKVWVKGMVH